MEAAGVNDSLATAVFGTAAAVVAAGAVAVVVVACCCCPTGVECSAEKPLSPAAGRNASVVDDVSISVDIEAEAEPAYA